MVPAGRMTVTSDGVVFFVEGVNLRTIDECAAGWTLARDLTGHRPSDDPTGHRHDIMGLWTDADKNVYLAVLGGRVVKRVDVSGRVSEVVRSDGPWGPTGGLVDPSGDLWLLESSDMNTVCVRRIRSGQTVERYGP